MRDYNRNSRSGGGGRYGGGGDFRRRDSRPREMHKAVCDECGKDCEVPFRPSGDKPIFCSKCFEGKEDGGSRRPNRRGPGGRSDFGRSDNTSKKMLEQASSINAKLDRILKVLEGKTESKPAAKKVKAKRVTKKVDPKVVKEIAPKEEKVEIETKETNKKEAEKTTPKD